MKTVFALLILVLYCESSCLAAETERNSSRSPTIEKWCIDVPYGNTNSSPEKIAKIAKEKISGMRAVGLIPLDGEQPTITKWDESSEICIKARASPPPPVELF